MDVDAELAACKEELEAAMRLGLGAVLRLAGSLTERAFLARDLLHRAVLLQSAGECYLVVHRNIPTPHHELALLALEQAKSNFMSAAILYEACGRAKAAAEVYSELLICLKRQILRMINHRNTETVAALLSPVVRQCESRLEILEKGDGTENFIYVNI